ncbi:hypothetical protein N7532_000203 [Penicillium argentinense]|uniref:Ankyrin repeat protein n=1 Tax=Penicillium argentinense TaxID=1131581 RepID=A0A9W9G565_9EURO|nr:uncharacterized protein N7532_000203 [Penicillium argentinense]KAJ5112158.1 hypothetical protein N7532_000203 [Penicillium argentinense]
MPPSSLPSRSVVVVFPHVWEEGVIKRAMALYEKGADLTAVDNNSGWTVFHHIAGCQPSNKFAEPGYRRTANVFTEKVPDLAVAANKDGKTPLAIATEQNTKWAMDVFGAPEDIMQE